MTKKFSEIKIGQEFHTNTDADGHEPYYYKVSGTEAYQFYGTHGQGLRHQMSPDDQFYLTGDIRQLSPSVTEIERAAITLLHQARPNHPALRAWIQALGTNPDEMRHIDDFIISAKLHEYEPFIYFPATDWFEPETFAERLQNAGYTASTEKYDFENSVWEAIFDCRPLSEGDGRYQFSDGRHVARLDKLILVLADALRDYRVSGRPTGDQTHTIQGMGGPLMSVSTSLAAAVVEYHENVLGEYSHYRSSSRQAVDRSTQRPEQVAKLLREKTMPKISQGG